LFRDSFAFLLARRRNFDVVASLRGLAVAMVVEGGDAFLRNFGKAVLDTSIGASVEAA
jgi:hypothetical protein